MFLLLQVKGHLMSNEVEISEKDNLDWIFVDETRIGHLVVVANILPIW